MLLLNICIGLKEIYNKRLILFEIENICQNIPSMVLTTSLYTGFISQLLQYIR